MDNMEVVPKTCARSMFSVDDEGEGPENGGVDE
jgi:hypothetical protein